jgi:hypothetical protein
MVGVISAGGVNMRKLLFTIAVLCMALAGFTQGKGDPRPVAADPAVGMIVPVGVDGYLWQILIPNHVKGWNLKVGFSYESHELIDADFPPCCDSPYGQMFAQPMANIPKGRLYATITSITQNWQVIKRNYILDSR